MRGHIAKWLRALEPGWVQILVLPLSHWGAPGELADLSLPCPGFLACQMAVATAPNS